MVNDKYDPTDDINRVGEIIGQEVARKDVKENRKFWLSIIIASVSLAVSGFSLYYAIKADRSSIPPQSKAEQQPQNQQPKKLSPEVYPDSNKVRDSSSRKGTK